MINHRALNFCYRIMIGKITMNEFNPKFLVNIHGKEYYDVAAAAKGYDGDVSRFFPEEAPGYFLKDGIFHVDAETFRRILQKPCAGDGAIKWTKYAVECYMPEPNPDPFDGILPVSRMSTCPCAFPTNSTALWTAIPKQARNGNADGSTHRCCFPLQALTNPYWQSVQCSKIRSSRWRMTKNSPFASEE